MIQKYIKQIEYIGVVILQPEATNDIGAVLQKCDSGVPSSAPRAQNSSVLYFMAWWKIFENVF